MNSNRIFTIVFLLVAIGLAYYLVDSIATSINTEKKIASQEDQIINQLKLIRNAQTAFLSVNGQYTSDWDKLINFIDSGRFYLVDKREIVIPLDYGADSIYIELDTLGTVSVKDSIFSKIPNFDLSRLAYVPVYDDVKFEVRADKITKSGVLVDVIEVWNPKPVDPRRDEESEYNTRKPLRFGSQNTVTVAGNWE
ncbi:MAG: hypothetical protein NXI20_27260 [bacterium]|nr:hypothetical protein [bacterium]